jgi:hypothetical protein
MSSDGSALPVASTVRRCRQHIPGSMIGDTSMTSRVIEPALSKGKSRFRCHGIGSQLQ